MLGSPAGHSTGASARNDSVAEPAATQPESGGSPGAGAGQSRWPGACRTTYHRNPPVSTGPIAFAFVGRNSSSPAPTDVTIGDEVAGAWRMRSWSAVTSTTEPTGRMPSGAATTAGGGVGAGVTAGVPEAAALDGGEPLSVATPDALGLDDASAAAPSPSPPSRRTMTRNRTRTASTNTPMISAQGVRASRRRWRSGGCGRSGGYGWSVTLPSVR